MKTMICQLMMCLLAFSLQAQTPTVSQEMKERIKQVEGLSLEVYMDGLYRAVGYGHRIVATDPEWVYDLEHYDEITQETADILFELDMLNMVNPGLAAVASDLGKDYPQNVYDVMGSLIYNMGLEGLRTTEFYRLFKEQRYRDAFEELLDTKSVKDGLLNRRFMELKVLMENFDLTAGAYVKNVQK